jgi:hypothetical protein
VEGTEGWAAGMDWIFSTGSRIHQFNHFFAQYQWLDEPMNDI